MKKIDFEQLSMELRQALEDVRHHRALIMKNGQPFAVISSVENKDEEDFDLEESPEFWRMIQERRREKDSVSLNESLDKR